jgi:hypothetical protein
MSFWRWCGSSFQRFFGRAEAFACFFAFAGDFGGVTFGDATFAGGTIAEGVKQFV